MKAIEITIIPNIQLIKSNFDKDYPHIETVCIAIYSIKERLNNQ